MTGLGRTPALVLALVTAIYAGWLLLSVKAQVEVVTQDVKTKPFGKAVLRCSLKLSQEPLIVTWQKKKAVSPENMVTYSKAHGVVVQPAYKDKVNITELGLWNSSITFRNVTPNEEGCYMCLFNTFLSGKISGTSCLSTEVPLKDKVLGFSFQKPQGYHSVYVVLPEDGLTNITCAATSKPACTISWNGTDTINGTRYSNITNSMRLADGSNRTQSMLLNVPIPVLKAIDHEFQCVLNYSGTNKTVYLTGVNRLSPVGHVDPTTIFYVTLTLCCLISACIVMITLLCRTTVSSRRSLLDSYGTLPSHHAPYDFGTDVRVEENARDPLTRIARSYAPDPPLVVMCIQDACGCVSDDEF